MVGGSGSSSGRGRGSGSGSGIAVAVAVVAVAVAVSVAVAFIPNAANNLSVCIAIRRTPHLRARILDLDQREAPVPV